MFDKSNSTTDKDLDIKADEDILEDGDYTPPEPKKQDIILSDDNEGFEKHTIRIVLGIIAAMVIVGVSILVFLSNDKEQLEEDIIDVEPVVEEVLIHELTQQEFDTILGQLFVKNENGEIISTINYVSNVLNNRINNLQEQINKLKEEE